MGGVYTQCEACVCVYLFLYRKGSDVKQVIKIWTLK